VQWSELLVGNSDHHDLEHADRSPTGTANPGQVILAIAGVFLTIPSFALSGLLIGPFRLGFTPAAVAL
jgi:hypothetical protein